MEEIRIPEKYQPISPAAYFWLGVLFTIPVVGFIFLIIFACSNGNINRRNFARSYFVPYIIAFVVIIIMLIVGGGTLGLSELLKALENA